VTKCADCKEVLNTAVIPAIENIALSYKQKVYTGKAIDAPELTVTDTAGKKITSYDVTGLEKQTQVGCYKVTVTFKGNYEGSTDLHFTIVPKKVSSASANLNSASATGGYNDIKFTWKAATGASGYLVYYKKASTNKWSSAASTTKTSYTKKDLAAGTKYSFKVVPYYKESGKTTKYYDTTQYRTASTTTLKKLTGVKVVKSGTKVKVSWSNIAGETGYQISKMTKKSATQKTPTTVKSTTAKSKVIAATKGKTYYYKVRAYKVVDGKKVYGPWSDVKAYKRK
jgi:lactocepin